MDRIIPAFWVVLISLILLISLSGEMDILALGRETAQSLGLPVKPLRLVLLALAAALAGAARQLCGAAGLCGGCWSPTSCAGRWGRTASPCCWPALWAGPPCSPCATCSPAFCSPPYVIPVGIVLSLAGGPFFIWLLLRQRGGGGSLDPAGTYLRGLRRPPGGTRREPGPDPRGGAGPPGPPTGAARAPC